jgi:hypothetical protein
MRQHEKIPAVEECTTMDLEPFVAATVAPGEPITAEAWNELVDGIRAVNEFIRTSQSASLQVQLGNTNIDRAIVRVSAERDDGLLVDAAAPITADGAFVFASLAQGAYTVRASAAGFATASAGTLIPTGDIVTLTLKADGAFMPNLMGVELAAALSELADRSIVVGRLLDVVGRELPPADPGPDYTNRPVLVQLPEPGTAIPPVGKVQLVVAAALQVEDSIEVPPLTGLTLTEARKALETIGLNLGDVETRTLAED